MAPQPPPRYLTADEVWAMHVALLQREGDQSVLRDRGALESAVQRPQMAAHYEQADLVTQAAILIAGLALAHPFLDGNKRTAATAGATFLRLNGYRIASAGDTFGRQVEALVVAAARDAALLTFVAWLRDHLVPL